jgi:transposase
LSVVVSYRKAARGPAEDGCVTNARTEAANAAIKHIKRTGRGYRNHRHYQARILRRSHRQTRRRRTRLNQQATTANCG